MKTAQARTIYLKDYTLPPFLIEATDLHVDLHEDCALVVSTLHMRRNPELIGNSADALVLDGQDLELQALLLNGRQLGQDEYQVADESLTIFSITTSLRRSISTLLQRSITTSLQGASITASQSPGSGSPADAPFVLECHTRIRPQENTSLEGLYKSHKMFCTQCEAEGFRKITYYLDRPDVMSVFTTTIVADRKRYPVLLSNGNPIANGKLEGGRHWATWHDPFRKPSYLFALVAGDLAQIDDEFKTASGRTVALRLFVEPKDLDKCDHALLSLKNAMRWDEEVYGREYDLDIFMIVAVDDFNMGAMENKGLNIFNTSCVLANPATTTDAAFQRVEAVVAHEYFHNWSGNRVTCRDWFQLSLKEGFTVYRDAEFSADMGSRTVKRIEDVSFLRTAQFAEDAGPMAHAVRPDSYMEISNFYTLTIYEKGAEVVRMINELLGPQKFRAGSDLYFSRHDGQAVTTEEFVKAMEDASGIDLSQFRNWYSQAGTPCLRITGSYNESARTYTLNVSQSCPETPGQATKAPFHIPLRMGLLGTDGQELPLALAGDTATPTERVLDVRQATEEFIFTGISTKPVPSLLRGFSAPVKLEFDYSQQDLLFLMTQDTDGFNRWNAGQELAVRVIQRMLRDYRPDTAMQLDAGLQQAFGQILDAAIADARGNNQLDKAMIAQLLTLPSEAYLSELADPIDVEGIHAVREFLLDALAQSLEPGFAELHRAVKAPAVFRADAEGIANRALRNGCLAYLMRLDRTQWIDACEFQFANADNMTDVFAALRQLVNSRAPDAGMRREKALQRFLAQWRHEALVVDQWFLVQATSPLPGTLERVQALLQHEAFDIRNPNKVRSLIGAYGGQNAINFHRVSGASYAFLADQILVLDRLNPQIASRLVTPLTRWKKYDPVRQQLMKAQLERIAAADKLSRDVNEIVTKSLK